MLACIVWMTSTSVVRTRVPCQQSARHTELIIVARWMLSLFYGPTVLRSPNPYSHHLGHHAQIGAQYITERNIPDLFEQLMIALMFTTPDDHIAYLISCLAQVKHKEMQGEVTSALHYPVSSSASFVA